MVALKNLFGVKNIDHNAEEAAEWDQNRFVKGMEEQIHELIEKEHEYNFLTKTQIPLLSESWSCDDCGEILGQRDSINSESQVRADMSST